MKPKRQRDDIPYSQVVEYLLNSVPELSQVYKEEQSKWKTEPIPAHVVYGSLFSDFLRQIIVHGTHNVGWSRSDIIRRSFRLVEKLAQSDDFETRCIVEASILESLLSQNKEDWQTFSPYFGEQTLALAGNLAERMGLRIEKRRQ